MQETSNDSFDKAVDYTALNQSIAHDIAEKGWSVQVGYFPDYTTAPLSERLDALVTAQNLTIAGIGRQEQHQIAVDIRRDEIYWLERSHAVDMAYLNIMADLRLALNQSLFLGLFEYEAHYARYPAGGFYKKHIDALKGGKNRILSSVCYLNENWQEQNGGQLVLYDAQENNRPVHTVKPELGTLAIFLSEDIPHEVLPAVTPRKSIAGWFRCNASKSEKVDPLL